ncbi:hypothetical protein QBC35DRAFT_530850 [Podospora australis]|uniref:Oxidoreductase n=1 Tax=Podospora australis TaxID=1536484 RepID=A0AAN7AL47_9PEZI|nr:hypothetical protein QBC35DRAFT_530850 [Podospora australis]
MASSRKKTILITGTSTSSIGASLAASFASLGPKYHIYATARDPGKIPASLSSLPNVTVLALDVASPDSISAAVASVSEGLDILINNAGIGYTTPLLDASLPRAQALFDVNLFARVIQAFSPLLIKSKGKVVNISSEGAVVYTPWIGVYSSSKAALNTLTDTLRLELQPLGVKVMGVMVGTVATKFHQNEAEVTLPRESRYRVIEGTIAAWGRGIKGPEGGGVEELAEGLVKEILGDDKRWVWIGRNSTE